MQYLRNERLDVVAVRLRDEIELVFPDGIARAEKLIHAVREAIEAPDPDFHRPYELAYGMMTALIQQVRANPREEEVPRVLGGYKLFLGRLAAAVLDPENLDETPIFVERFSYGFIAVFDERVLHLSLAEVTP